MQTKKRLLHIEHFGIMRDIVRIFLEKNEEIFLVQGECNFNNLLQQIKEQEIDILILGNTDPDGETFNYPGLCRSIRLQFPGIRIIVHSNFATNNHNHISQIMNAGAHGFVTNDMGFDDITAAISAVKKDGRYLSKQISSFFKNTFEFLAGLADRLEQRASIFTKREVEVLTQVAKGLTTKQIADSLQISNKTVETHRKHLVTKAKVKNTAELIAYSISCGFIFVNT